MTPALVLLWLGTAGGRTVYQPDLDGWAASRGVVLEDPAPGRAMDAATHDDDLATRIEALLAEARSASYAEDAGAATRALDAARALVTDHPALPESPWLLAEALRIEGELVKTREPARAAELERRARAIDGPLSPAFVAQPASSAPGRAPAARLPMTTPGGAASPGVRLQGSLPTDEVDVDGAPAAYPPTSPSGVHHVRVLRSGRLAWAGWMEVGGSEASIPLPSAEPCSDGDLAGVRSEGRFVRVSDAVTCPRYAVARSLASGGVEVAVCERTACGPWLPWSRGWGRDYEGPAHPPWPTPQRNEWIVWTAVGIASALVGGFALYEAGAFETRGPPRDTFTFVSPARPPR